MKLNENLFEFVEDKSANSYRGTSVQVISHGEWDDPELSYEGKIYDYYEIENSLWQSFLDEINQPAADINAGDMEVEMNFNKYVQEHIYDLLSSLKESLNETEDGSKEINESLNTGALGAKVGDKIKDTKTGKIGEVKKEGQVGNYNLIYVDFGEGRLRKINSMDDAQVTGRYELVKDNNLDETLYDLSRNEDERLIQLQGLVDNAVKLFGRVPGSFYDDFDDVGYYITDEDGKYIVKKKVQSIKESYVVEITHKDGNRYADQASNPNSLVDSIEDAYQFDTVEEANDWLNSYNGDEKARIKKVTNESLKEDINAPEFTVLVNMKDEDNSHIKHFNNIDELNKFKKENKDKLNKIEVYGELGQYKKEFSTLDEDIESTELISDTYEEPVNINNGLVSIVNNLIQDEWQAIQGYNDAIVNFEAEGKSELTQILKDLVAEENVHVGQLEVLLQQLDTSADKIAEGEAEASQQVINDNTSINEDYNTSLDYLINTIGFNPYEDIDYSKNPKALEIVNTFKKYNKVNDLFDYIASGIMTPFKSEDEYLAYVADIDIKDFESYNGSLDQE